MAINDPTQPVPVTGATPTRRGLNARQAAERIGISVPYLESPRGKEMFPPTKIGGRNVWYSDILDRQIDRLAIESGALPVGGDA